MRPVDAYPCPSMDPLRQRPLSLPPRRPFPAFIGLDTVLGRVDAGCVPFLFGSGSYTSGMAFTIGSLTPARTFKGPSIPQLVLFGTVVGICGCEDDSRCEGSGSCSTQDEPIVEQAQSSSSSSVSTDVNCTDFRNRLADEGVTIVIRNERAEPIYVAPETYRCGLHTFVTMATGGRPLTIADPDSCRAPSCEEMQDPMYVPDLCNDECSVGEEARIDPGGELVVGTFRASLFSHGVDGIGREMPGSCFRSSNSGSSTGSGIGCYSQVPLGAGTYDLSARAFLSRCLNDDPSGGSCECVSPTSGDCLVDQWLDAVTSFAFPTPKATLLFE